MNSPRATVSKILTYSIVDGPGNRLVIFLQGCNFDCTACHNPHTIGECNNCGDCVPACHADALSLVDGRIGLKALEVALEVHARIGDSRPADAGG